MLIRNGFKFLVISLLIFFCSLSLASINMPIKVGVVFNPPFVFKEDIHYTGVAIEFWRRIAERNNWQYKFIPMSNNIEADINDVAAGKIDILLGDISTTYSRTLKVDFSRPFFINKVGLVIKNKKMSLLETLKFYTTLNTIQLIYILLIIYIISANLFWLVERKHNDHLSKSYFSGITATLWDFIFHLLGGSDLVEPKTRLGHFIALSWLIILFFSLVTITAGITSELTVAKVSDYSDFTSLESLKYKTIAAVQGRSDYQLATKVSSHVIGTVNLQQALGLLEMGKVEAVLEDYTVAQQELTQLGNKDLFMSKLIIQYDEYAFPFPKQSPLEVLVNQGISYLQDYGFAQNICKAFLVDTDAQFCSL